MGNKILLCCSPPVLSGGVSHFYKMLRPYFAEGTVHFFYGKAVTQTNGAAKLFFLIADLLKFLFVSPRYKIIYLNPSLGASALLRDGLYYMTARWLFHKKVVVFWHGWNFSFAENLPEKRILFLFFQTTLRKADLSFCLSEAIRQNLQRFHVTGAVKVMTTAFDDALCQIPINSEKRGNKENFRILFLGRAEKEKGIFELAEIFANLRTLYSNVQLVYAGCGSQEQALKNWIQNKNITNVSFSGYVEKEKKYSELENADCYCLPSYTEGLPCSVLEAMAAGLPVLVTPVGGVPDFFENDKMGWMIPLENKKEWVSRLEELIKDPEKKNRISAYNRQYAAEHFAASKVAMKIMKEINEL